MFVIPRAARIALVGSGLLLGSVALSACGDDAPAKSETGASATEASSKTGAAKELAFELTDTGCDPVDATVAAGPVKFVVKNPGTTKTDELELRNADGIIMGERENIAPGLGADFTLTLKPGKYELLCTFQNAERDGGTITVTGDAQAGGGGGSAASLDKAVGAYRTYVEAETDQLVADVTAFAAALKAGDTAKAKELFGPTRVHYETIEPIAESFGDLDPRIDARANDVADRSTWTGFHRIEQILFQKNTTKGTAKYADQLLKDVKELQAQIPDLELQAAQVANGAIGLLDEVSASKITGEEDRYSHTDLSDFQANFDGAVQAFTVLEPALQERGEGELVSDIKAQIATVQKGLDRYRRDTPLGFALYSELTPADRRQFSQQITSLAEPMSLMAGKVLN